MSIFSIRHRRALASGKIDVQLDERLRGRLWRLMSGYNQSFDYRPDPSDRWTSTTDYFEQVYDALLDASGENRLTFDGEGMSLEEWVRRGPGPGVFDAVEFFYLQVDEGRRPAFKADLNGVFREEDASWQLLEGHFVPLDSVSSTSRSWPQAMTHSARLASRAQLTSCSTLNTISPMATFAEPFTTLAAPSRAR